MTPCVEGLEPRLLLSTITVNSLADVVADDGRVTLREAILAANTDADPSGDTLAGSGADVIRFDEALSGGTIALEHGQLSINTPVFLVGPGAAKLTIDAQQRGRAFMTEGDVSVVISGLTIANGSGVGAGGTLLNRRSAVTLAGLVIRSNSAEIFGGGVYSSVGSLRIDATTFMNHRSGRYGGGVAANSQVDIFDRTISGNRSRIGGGMYIRRGPGTLLKVTVTENVADLLIGGVIARDGALTLNNTIVAGNRANRTFSGSVHDLDVYGAANPASSFNLVGRTTIDSGLADGVNGNLVGSPANPLAVMLAPLADHGGPTPTHALLPQSSAINAGDTSLIWRTTDQRGVDFSRVRGGSVDIGSYEAGATLSVRGPAVVEDGAVRMFELDMGGALRDTSTPIDIDWGDGSPPAAASADAPTVPHAFMGLGSYWVVAGATLDGERVESAPLVVDVVSGGFIFRQSGGSDRGRAAAEFVDGGVHITDGDSFSATLSRQQTILPSEGILVLGYTDLNFDDEAGASNINDALEFALLDDEGRSLVSTIGAGRDTFFNATESQAVRVAEGARFADGVVSVDVSHLAGRTVTVVARLVNNDGDLGSSVRIDTGNVTRRMAPPPAASAGFKRRAVSCAVAASRRPCNVSVCECSMRG